MSPEEQVRAAGCDSPGPPSIMQLINQDTGQVSYVCRCLVCSRCKRHTGNANQGHYWAYCKITKTDRDFHFCCPDNCELETTFDARS